MTAIEQLPVRADGEAAPAWRFQVGQTVRYPAGGEAVVLDRQLTCRGRELYVVRDLDGTHRTMLADGLLAAEPIAA